MGDLTRATMEASVKFRLGNRTDVDTILTDAVKFSYDELTTAIRIPETQESASSFVVEGQSTYAVPTDLYSIVSLRNNTDKERLYPLSIRQYDRIQDSSNGKPTHYIWWRNEIILRPVPDSTIRVLLLRYIKRLASLSTSASVSALPREWDEVIIQGAYFRMLRWLGMKQEAQVEEAAFGGMVARRLDRIAETTSDREDTAKPVLTERTAP